MEGQQKFKLHYFPLYGRGEYVRVALVAAGADWEDCVVQFKDWGDFKAQTPNGYLPCLQVNGGEMLDNVKALTRFVCDLHGMYPTDPDEVYNVELVIEILSEDCNPLNAEFVKTPFDKKVETLTKTLKEKLEGMLERVHKNSETSLSTHGWAAGSKISFADCNLFTWMSMFCYRKGCSEFTEPLMKKFPLLAQHYQRMLQHNGGALQKYIDDKPEYPF